MSVQPDCSLHIHIKSSRANGFQSILTQDSAIGLIMALGNLGRTLSNSARDVSACISLIWYGLLPGHIPPLDPITLAASVLLP